MEIKIRINSSRIPFMRKNNLINILKCLLKVFMRMSLKTRFINFFVIVVKCCQFESKKMGRFLLNLNSKSDKIMP